LLEEKDRELEASRQDSLKLTDDLSGLQVEVKDLKEKNGEKKKE